jgi:rod shape-determining protein MreB and related proteins
MSVNHMQPVPSPEPVLDRGPRRGRRRRTARGIAIDLGTSMVRIASAGHVLVEEPSVIARSHRGCIVGVGTDARAMLGRNPSGIEVVEPIVDAAIADVELAEHLLRSLLTRRGLANGWAHDVVVAVPVLEADLQRRAVLQCVQRVLPQTRVMPVEAPLAAALGAEVAVQDAFGTMVVDIGHGATEAAVCCLGELVTSHIGPVGGATAEAAVMDHLLARYDLHLGRHSAERLVRLTSQPQCRSVIARGLDRATGLPRAMRFVSGEIREVLAPVVDAIAEVARAALDAAPDELAADVMQAPIVLTGGGSRLHQVPLRIAERTGLDVTVRDTPDRAAIDGARRRLAWAQHPSMWSDP